jgi:hypothetical protein
MNPAADPAPFLVPQSIAQTEEINESGPNKKPPCIPDRLQQETDRASRENHRATKVFAHEPEPLQVVGTGIPRGAARAARPIAFGFGPEILQRHPTLALVRDVVIGERKKRVSSGGVPIDGHFGESVGLGA